jgi:hypothetical protein
MFMKSNKVELYECLIIASLFVLFGYVIGVMAEAWVDKAQYIINFSGAFFTAVLAIVAIRGLDQFKKSNIHAQILTEHKRIKELDSVSHLNNVHDLPELLISLSNGAVFLGEKLSKISKSSSDIKIEFSDLDQYLDKYENLKSLMFESLNVAISAPIINTYPRVSNSWNRYGGYWGMIYKAFYCYESLTLVKKFNHDLEFSHFTEFMKVLEVKELDLENPDLKSLTDLEFFHKVLKRLNAGHEEYIMEVDDVLKGELGY